MKVYGLQANSGGLPYVDNNRPVKVSSSKSRKGDLVEISKSAKTSALDTDSIAQGAATVDYPPRTERIRDARQLVADGSYNRQDYLEKLAEEMIDSPAITGAISSDGASAQKDARTERTTSVAKVYDQVQQNYYDSRAVMEEVANRLIEVLGFSRLF